MTARAELPKRLRGAAFSLLDASDVPRSRLMARDLDRRFIGARFPSGGELPLRAAAALAACPPGTVIGGASAARLLGLPLPHGLASDDEVHVITPAPGRAIRRRGVRGRVLELSDGDTVRSAGLVVTGAGRTWCDLAGSLTIPQLVAIADRVPEAELRAALDRHRGRRFRDRLETALRLRDARSESPPESELRCILCLEGLPALIPQQRIYDERGRFVARVDLLFPEHRVVLEYQGDHHRTDRAQWRRDLQRRAELEALGYRVIDITALDLRDPHALVRRIARILARSAR
ncbi:endonuclease domain-containing protein [Agromyces archimandritae]|uniref:DUF559 domain-containing protein n=1 Tax=Agromyces archimandritae TaxID=2781962 RepID=A0A975FJZ6_9MICO|nr:hypothetical protein [Agromyces archimandritae]QTX03459.1 hypothetical protein G127AT_08775 [Agromyces archimandritae]